MSIVAAGWWDLADAAAYYPEDLPSDWRLAYFANEHAGVYVPAVAWREMPGHLLRAWRDDVPAGFRFFLEWPEGGDNGAERAAVALADRLAGWVRWPGGDPTGTLLDAAPVRPTARGRALWCPPSIVGDLRAGARWLRTQTTAAPTMLVVLSQPSSGQLADWQRLQHLLGLDELRAAAVPAPSA